MSSNLEANWPWITAFFKKSIATSRFYAFATTNPDGSAHAAPYASLVLNPNCTGFYSDCFPNRMSRNLKTDPRICILAVHLGFWQWLRALFLGRFDGWPGVRLYGTVGPNREAAPEEVERWRRRVKRYKGMKGYNLLWKDVHTVRDIRFERFEPVRLGTMTRHLSAYLG